MRINIYIQEKDNDVLDYINDQLNKSKYIVNLVRRDMENKVSINREEIIKLIKEYAGQIKNTSDSDNEVEESVKELLDW